MNRAARRRAAKKMSSHVMNNSGKLYPVRLPAEPFDVEAEIAISEAIYERLAVTVALKNTEHACRLAGVELDDAKALLTQFALECQPVIDLDAAAAGMKRVMELMEDQPTERAELCRQMPGNG